MSMWQFGTLGPAYADIQTLINQVRGEVVTKAGLIEPLNIYNAVSVRTQELIGGKNWLVKVNIGSDFIHLMIHKMEGTEHNESPTLTRLQQGHLADDPLAPF